MDFFGCASEVSETLSFPDDADAFLGLPGSSMLGFEWSVARDRLTRLKEVKFGDETDAWRPALLDNVIKGRLAVILSPSGPLMSGPKPLPFKRKCKERAVCAFF